MADAVGIAQLSRSRSRIAAADDGDGIALCQSLCHCLGTGSELLHLKDAHGSVPDHSGGVPDLLGKQFPGGFADVQTLPAVRNLPGGNGAGIGLLTEGVGNHSVHRQQQAHTLFPGLCQQVPGQIQLISSQSESPMAPPCALMKV